MDSVTNALRQQRWLDWLLTSNLEVWETDANVIRETVKVARDYLLDICPPDEKPHTRKDQEPGRPRIAEFLGGVWNQSYGQNLIKEALAEIRETVGVAKEYIKATGDISPHSKTGF